LSSMASDVGAAHMFYDVGTVRQGKQSKEAL
jgi:hypothetical protein